MKRLFVSGTDTGVGKTTVSCGLAAAFRRSGRSVATLKPVETGCLRTARGDLLPADALRLAQAAGEPLPPARPLAALCPNRFEVPASPEAAAAAEQRRVDRAAIAAAVADRLGADLVLFEGAGGLLVPLGPDWLQVDLVGELAAPLLVVARDALGTVNHTLLTLEAARARSLPVAGVVLHATSAEPGPDSATNADAIGRHGRVRIFGRLPWSSSEDPEALADLAERHLDLEGLWRAL